MDALRFSTLLVNYGFIKINSGYAGINMYKCKVRGDIYMVGVMNCMEECQYSAMQLVSIERRVQEEYGCNNVLFTAFTYDAYNTRMALSGDYRHWIYDERMQQLQIYDDQPDEFLNLKKMIEYQPVKRDTKSYLLTANNLVVAVNVLVFIVMEIIGNTKDIDFLINHGALYTESIFKGHEYYRLITCMFMHSGVSHIFNNMLVLLFIGDNLERAVGKIKYFIIYIGSGIMGSVVSLVIYNMNNKVACCVGASGAIFGVIGAMIFILIRNKGRLEDLTLWKILLYVLLTIYLGLRSTGVSLSAHMGGLVFGFLFATLLYRKRGRIYEN